MTQGQAQPGEVTGAAERRRLPVAARALAAILWWVAAGAMIAAGTSRLGGVFAEQMPAAGSGPYASSDHWLSVLQVPRPSEAIRNLAGQLPADAALLVVADEADPSFWMTYYVISYLSWPHQVGLVTCGEPGKGPVRSVQPGQRIETALYYGTRVPGEPEGTSVLSPRLELVPVKEAREWVAFCP